jgi:hypothetical protein
MEKNSLNKRKDCTMKKLTIILLALFVFSTTGLYAGVQDTPKKGKAKTEKTVKKMKKSKHCSEESECKDKSSKECKEEPSK